MPWAWDIHSSFCVHLAKLLSASLLACPKSMFFGYIGGYRSLCLIMGLGFQLGFLGIYVRLFTWWAATILQPGGYFTYSGTCRYKCDSLDGRPSEVWKAKCLEWALSGRRWGCRRSPRILVEAVSSASLGCVCPGENKTEVGEWVKKLKF